MTKEVPELSLVKETFADLMANRLKIGNKFEIEKNVYVIGRNKT